jgi:hypothetical protein
MANFIIEALNIMLPTPQPDIRSACIEMLRVEIARAENEVFSAGSGIEATSDYKETFEISKRKCELADERHWLSHETLDLPTFWLAMVGYRLSIEEGLLYGSMRAAQIRAAEVLKYSPLAVREWTADILFDVYVNTALRHEWKYDGSHFRFAEQRV